MTAPHNKLDLETVTARAREVHGGKYKYPDQEYVNNSTPLAIICPEHGEFWQTARAHVHNGQGCPECGKSRLASRNRSRSKHTGDSFIKKARDVHGDKYDYSKVDYTATHTKVRIVCPKHGEFEQKPVKHLQGQGCRRCAYESFSSGGRIGTDSFIRRAREIHGDKYDYSKTEYRTALEYVTIICPDHGEFRQWACSHLNKRGCPECWKDRRGKTLLKDTDWFADAASKAHQGFYDYSRVRCNKSKEGVEIVCPDHGAFWQRPNDHLMGHGCPSCSHAGPSKPEQEIEDWLTAEIPDIRVTRNTRSVIPPMELDLYLPDHSLALEYNGAYWHQFREPSYHQWKKLKCLENGIDLIHVHEHLWRKRQQPLKDLILSRIRPMRSFDARNCVVLPVEKSAAADFCERNHIQGYAQSGHCLGLFPKRDTDTDVNSGDTLLGVMTFGKPRFSNNYDWEIIRMCFTPGTRVRGGAGKLLKHFVRRECGPGQTVCSYAQLDWSSGSVYERMGMRLDGLTVPGYGWTHAVTGEFLSRHKTRKSRLENLLGDGFDPESGEAENMAANGFFKTYNAGSRVYSLTVPDSGRSGRM